ncbi:MAG TPA: formylglycine-generating enzyme family protein [Hyphomicrobiaceae bacterium]|nr:formylglycine-generating enzyme family protein [Hyphomicrobiaceae bacterium]
MKAKAGDLLASLDRSASDKERKAKEAAKLKAREEAEKKAKEETGTAPTGPSDPATSAYCDRLKTYLAARAAAKDASAVRYVTGQSLCPDLQDEAKAILRTLDDAGGTPAPTPLPADADPARGIEPGSGRGFVDHLRDGSACSHCPELVVVPADRFMIGSPSSEAYRSPDEGPTREIAIARPFAIGRMEVTRGQFRAFVDSTGHQPAQNCSIWDGQNWKIDQTMTWLSPGYEQDEDHPVVCVSHADAVKYAEWLSEQTGHVYQLPSEAEWEYAARAGTSERYPFGASDGQICRFANVADSAAKKVNPSWTTVRCSDGFANTAPVGHFEASAWGLHDMIGNVSEWTDDCATGSYDGYPGDGSPAKTGDCERRPHRGAGWSSTSEEARVARRSFYFGEERFPTVGFRLVRVIAD